MMGNPVRLWAIALITSTLSAALTLLLISPSASQLLSPLITPILTRLFTPPDDLGGWAGHILTEAILALLSGGLTLLLLRGQVGQAIDLAQGQPIQAALFGLGAVLTALTFPVLAIWVGGGVGALVMLAGAAEMGTAITLLMAGASAGAGGLALVALLLGGRFLAALGVAVLIIPQRWARAPRITFARLLFTVALLTVIGIIPFFGWLISLIFSLVGAGALIRALPIFNSARTHSTGVDPARLPPPIIEDRPAAPGMDNLPSGFTWWE